jgi:hypothetical protein
MTWHSFFNFSTMQNRHLLASYAVVLIIQGGYASWIAWNWFHARGTHR